MLKKKKKSNLSKTYMRVLIFYILICIFLIKTHNVFYVSVICCCITKPKFQLSKRNYFLFITVLWIDWLRGHLVAGGRGLTWLQSKGGKGKGQMQVHLYRQDGSILTLIAGISWDGKNNHSLADCLAFSCEFSPWLAWPLHSISVSEEYGFLHDGCLVPEQVL